jgi:hypothetical protein
MSDPIHAEQVAHLLLKYDYLFRERSRRTGRRQQKGTGRAVSTNMQAAHHARLLWLFCVQLCRELFSEEHRLSPYDAQVLGLLDEVCGGGPVQSRREFEMARIRSAQNRGRALKRR